MKSAVFFGFLSALFVCAESLNPLLSRTRANVVPNRYIIEVEHSSSLNRRGDVIHPLDAVYHQIKSRDIPHQVIKEFKMDGIFNGAVLDVKNEDVNLIKNTPGVKAIRPVSIFSSPKPAKFHLQNRADVPPDTLSSHILSGVEKVHAEGNIGTDVKIGIIDTGVDYNHPQLSSQVKFGHDFVGDDYNPEDPSSKPIPDDDPMDCQGHGTHVAGIIAAQPGNIYNISGVAYGATLGAYKVFDCKSSTSDDIIIEALMKGAEDGMDILTLSLGEPGGWASTMTSVVAGRLAQRGIIVTVAAGNDGDYGAWYASSPASGKGVISIGSVDNTAIPSRNATVHGVDHLPITYFSSFPFNISVSLPVYATSNMSVEDDACSPLALDTPQLSKYLTVIRIGGCSITKKFRNAAAKGANTIFFYDNGDGVRTLNGINTSIASIQAADGEFLVKQFVAGAPITLSFPDEITYFQDDHGGLMSDFSTYGPSFDFGFNPSVAAPGANILSTYPVSMGSFAILSGTSMATPFAAGAAALLLSAKAKSLSDRNGTRNLLETTATKILALKNDTGFETLIKAGAGLLNVYNAIHSTTIVSPGELILNDTAHFQRNHTILIQNIGDMAKNYTLKHVPALTALTMDDKSILPSVGPVPLVSAPATVKMEPVSFTVQAGASQQVAIDITLPTTMELRYPIYSGFVEVTSGSESYHVSYIGLGASLKDHQIFDNSTEVSDVSLPALYNQNVLVQQSANYTFRGKDYPLIIWRLAMGTPALHIDLVGSDMTFIGALDFQEYVPRNGYVITDVFSSFEFRVPSFMNRTKIPNGSYRVLLRALKITGDPSSQGDYERWVSPIIGIQV